MGAAESAFDEGTVPGHVCVVLKPGNMNPS